MVNGPYRGRLAPSPTGYLHLGHARTFWRAQQRARAAQGVLVLRMEDLDGARCRPEFAEAIIEDLRWLGLDWQEGPDVGGPCGPYRQSERMDAYRIALKALETSGHLYRCYCSRKDIQAAVAAPNLGEDELIYPGTCRSRAESEPRDRQAPFSWRFRVRDGEKISFLDQGVGKQSFVAGRDFGDFVLWRPDDVPAYQLAVTVDDAAMGITEVVRGMDLLVSTARQLLLYRALGLTAPTFFHCSLMTDEKGVRLAKRDAARSLRQLRASGMTPASLIAGFGTEETAERPE